MPHEQSGWTESYTTKLISYVCPDYYIILPCKHGRQTTYYAI